MASQAIFVGFERMDFTAISLVSQAIVYCALSPLLVFLGYGALGPMLGYTFSYMIAGIVSVVLLYSFIFRKLKPHGIPNFEVFATLKVLFRYGIPLAIANLFSGLFIQFSSFMMAHYSDVVLVGHYKIALNFAVLITFFTGPIATVLFPAFSKIDLGNKQELLRSVYSSSVKYTTLFSFPVTVAMIVLSAPMVSTLYGDKWFYSPFFLSLYVVQYLFVALGAITNNMLLQGLGETKMLMKLTLLTLSFGLPLGFLLIPPFEIVGLIITSLLATLPSLFVGMYWIWRRYRIRVDFNSSVRLCLASAIAGLLTYIFLNTFPTAAWIKLISGATLFLFIYLISAPVIGAINQTDINNLRAMFSGLGIVSKLLEIPFVLIEKSLKISKNLSLVSEQK
jgi:O-antigen/teichoic acid export membrane protein